MCPRSRTAVWLHLDIASMPYEKARQLQLAVVDAKGGDGGLADVVIFLEHPPVFTLGRRGRRDHLKVTQAFLEAHGLSLIHTERGGDVTYHGPGQLVSYPVVDLRANGWRVVDFVAALEEVMIRTVLDWGILARRNPLNRGVWVGMEKIGSVGIAVRRGISFHGFALNVNPDLTPFSWIDPCGLRGIRMTSMERLGKTPPMDEVRRSAKHHTEAVFHVTLQETSLHELGDLLKGPGSSSECMGDPRLGPLPPAG